MSREIKVKFPKKFCDYWWEKPKTWEIKNSVKCDICDDPIVEGEEYFEIDAKEEDIKRGHLYHLEYAEKIEWVPKESTE